jgi:hypothetical protein
MTGEIPFEDLLIKMIVQATQCKTGLGISSRLSSLSLGRGGD